MKLYLLPPSEGKKPGGSKKPMSRTFAFPLPSEIAQTATQKDLKCKGNRYEESILLNTTIDTSPVLPAIKRYTGVLYTSLGYETLQPHEQERITKHVCIVSGLFGLLCPSDRIPNYKLPGEARGVRVFQYLQISPALLEYCQKHKIAEIVDLLSGVYQRMIDWKLLQQAGIVHTIPDVTEGVQVTHAIKALRGARLRQTCIEEFSI